MKKLLAMICISLAGISFYACDEIDKIINPSDDVLIDITVSPSTTETILSKDNDIQIIIPGGALSEDATFKVEKNTKPPAMTIDKMILGNNTYNIKISGQASFNAPIQIVINYSQSKLDDNSWTSENVKGLIYANGSWAEATHNIDATNKKIIISINSPSGKAKQNNYIPLTDGEITIGDGYTTIDSGDDDNLLKGMKIIDLRPELTNGRIYSYSNANSNGANILKDIGWSGTSFFLDLDTSPGNPHSTNCLMNDHYIFRFNAQSPSVGCQKIISFDVVQIDNWNWLDGAWLDSAESYMSFKDVPLTFVSEDKDSLIYEITEAFNSSNVESFYLMVGGIDFLDMSEYANTYGKADLNKVRIIFTK